MAAISVKANPQLSWMTAERRPMRRFDLMEIQAVDEPNLRLAMYNNLAWVGHVLMNAEAMDELALAWCRERGLISEKIIVVVEGGCVRDVKGLPEGVDYTVADFDVCRECGLLDVDNCETCRLAGRGGK